MKSANNYFALFGIGSGKRRVPDYVAPGSISPAMTLVIEIGMVNKYLSEARRRDCGRTTRRWRHTTGVDY